MRIELAREARASAIQSLQRYFEENLPEPIGDLPAGLLLDFILKEIGPAIYNGAVKEAQARLQARVADLDGELYLEPFQFWSKGGVKRGR